MTIRIEAGQVTFIEGISVTVIEVKKDELGMIDYYIEALENDVVEYIISVNGVPSAWRLFDIGGPR